MKTICQYCHILKHDDGVDDKRVSHGLCENCYRLENILMDLKELQADRDFLRFTKRDPNNVLLEKTFQTLNGFLMAMSRISRKKNQNR